MSYTIRETIKLNSFKDKIYGILQILFLGEIKTKHLVDEDYLMAEIVRYRSVLGVVDNGRTLV